MDYDNELEHFSLRWNNFNDNMKSGFHDLLRREDFVDVTIAAEGKLIQAHKMVLSVCSPYFKSIFKTNPCQHPIVFLKDVSHKELSGILQFMYLGEVSVQQEELGRFLKTAEALQIKGLTGENEDDKKSELQNSLKENNKLVGMHKNKLTHKCIEDDPPDIVVPVKKAKRSSSPHSTKVSYQVQRDVEIVPKTEPRDDMSDGLGREDGDSFAHLLDAVSTVGEDSDLDPQTAANAALGQDLFSGVASLADDTFTMAGTNQEIRFVMSPRRRPCLVFNNYVYIKDHLTISLPGQPRTVYWRCKEVTCKARCIQTHLRFRLKANTYHLHAPNIDSTYTPMNTRHAYEILRLFK